MKRLLPGSWTLPLINQLTEAYRQYNTPPYPRSPVTFEEMMPLLAALDFTHIFHTLDPWSHDNSHIRRALQQTGHLITANSHQPGQTVDYHLNPLQPDTYQQINNVVGINSIVSSPWSHLADPAMALATTWADTVTCLHVPRTYVTNAHISHPPRLAFLKQYQHQQRLMCLSDLPKSSDGQRYMWVIIFASKELMRLIVRPEFQGTSLPSILGS